MSSKEKSVEAARSALRASLDVIAPWAKKKCKETAEESTIDLLASLRHLADSEGFNFSDAVAESQILYQEEIDGTDGEEDHEDADSGD